MLTEGKVNDLEDYSHNAETVANRHNRKHPAKIHSFLECFFSLAND